MRRNVKLFALGCAALLCTGGAAFSSTIDFEGLPAGTIVSSVSADDGTGPVLVKGLNPKRFGSLNTALIFDSSNPTGRDDDLGSPNQDFGGPGKGVGGRAGSPWANTTALGKILIIAENLIDKNGDGLVDDPDDEGYGPYKAFVQFEFDFTQLAFDVTVESITVIDSEEPGPEVQLFDASGALIGFFNLPMTGDNGVATSSLGPTAGVARMVVALHGSGGIDNIVFGEPPSCGDGKINPPETCDPPGDPFPPNDNQCRNDCTYCGDGNEDPSHGETCDDGNNVPDDDCRNDCTSCGDGNKDPQHGETCDDGNDVPDDSCRNDCTSCGDGNKDPQHGETCDDGNTNNDDGCRNDCTFCGDGTKDPSEECDPNDPATPDCRDDCTLPRCGDGIVDPPDETCDPPGSVPSDGEGNICRDSCTYCGDGVPNNGEECDFNDPDAPPSCKKNCTIEPICNLLLDKTADPETLIPTPAPSCQSEDKDLNSLTFRYTGGGCGASDNSQDAKKTSCSGSIDPSAAVTVSAAGGGSGDKPYNVSPTSVGPGGEFTVTPQGSSFQSDSWVFLKNGGGEEKNKFHTSCSQPLEVGDVFGSVTLVGINGKGQSGNTVTYTYEVTNLGDAITGLSVVDDKLGTIASGVDIGNGQTKTFTKDATITETTTNVATATGDLLGAPGVECTATDTATVTVAPPPGSCADGKPKTLVFKYTGESCAASKNQQGDKAKCSGDPNGAQPIKVVCTSKDCTGSSPKIVVIPSDQSVDVGETVKVDAAGRDTLHSNTKLKLTQNGVTLQELEIHTSCSQPLAVGDQYGSLLLVEFIPEQ